MMSSTTGGGGNGDYEEDFPPNPFRSTMTGELPPQQQQQGDFFQPYGTPMQQQPYPQQQQQQQPQGMTFQPQYPPMVTVGPMDNKMEAAAATNNSNNINAASSTGRLGGPLSWITSCLACCTVHTYKSYFDLDTEDVKTRIKAAVTSFYKADFFRNEVLGVGERTDTLKGPDLYGPFWITMTLIFIVAVCINYR